MEQHAVALITTVSRTLQVICYELHFPKSMSALCSRQLLSTGNSPLEEIPEGLAISASVNQHAGFFMHRCLWQTLTFIVSMP